jgi:glycosyltransferase involved in cell wall biosynthesis
VLATALSVHRAARTFARVALFSSVSEFVRDKLRQAGIDADRIRVKPNFAWSSPRREGRGSYFLILSRISPEKGIDVVVDHVPAGSDLLVVGDGPERSRLMSSARRSGVEFRPRASAGEVEDLLRGARALLVPSRCYEGQPRVILEAFAAGVPVLASRLGGLPEVVSDNHNGLLVDHADGRAWTAAMEQLMDDDTCDRLGRGAFHSWESAYTPERAIQNLESLYREALAREARRS